MRMAKPFGYVITNELQPIESLSCQPAEITGLFFLPKSFGYLESFAVFQQGIYAILIKLNASIIVK